MKTKKNETKLEEKINAAAYEYAVNHSSAPDKETPDWIIADFKAGAMWAILTLSDTNEGRVIDFDEYNNIKLLREIIKTTKSF